jgi:hypothetical protein
MRTRATRLDLSFFRDLKPHRSDFAPLLALVLALLLLTPAASAATLNEHNCGDQSPLATPKAVP